MELRVVRAHPDAVVPRRATAGAAGYDLFALASTTVAAGGWTAAPTGIRVAIPPGHYGRIAPRSGLAVDYGIDVLAGVIDEDYRGELVVVLINHGRDGVTIPRTKAAAQLIIESITHPAVVVVETLSETVRGQNGFGSTNT
jgi:dUTP pyrophosphatase